MNTERKSALDLPEISHMLDVMIGAQQALDDLMKTVQKDKDPSIIRLCVTEAENISKTAVRLAQSMSSWEAENPGQVRRNDPPPPPDPATDEMMARFMSVMSEVGNVLRDKEIDRHVERLDRGAWNEDMYQRSRDHVVAPDKSILSIPDYLEILRRHRGLSPPEQADYDKLRSNE